MKYRRGALVPPCLALLAAIALLPACSDTSPGTGDDAGIDAGTDSGVDGGIDGGASQKRIFITSTGHDANFGGLDGADQVCASQAADAGLEGEFKAWLSTLSVSASDRLTHADGPYVMVDGTLIANDWGDLVDGSIEAFINLDANGDLRGGDTWTGTLTTGASYSIDDCGGFTIGGGRLALCGTSAATGTPWTENVTPDCATRLRLYCIQQ